MDLSAILTGLHEATIDGSLVTYAGFTWEVAPADGGVLVTRTEDSSTKEVPADGLAKWLCDDAAARILRAATSTDEVHSQINAGRAYVEPNDDLDAATRVIMAAAGHADSHVLMVANIHPMNYRMIVVQAPDGTFSAITEFNKIISAIKLSANEVRSLMSEDEREILATSAIIASFHAYVRMLTALIPGAICAIDPGRPRIASVTRAGVSVRVLAGPKTITIDEAIEIPYQPIEFAAVTVIQRLIRERANKS
jgi:hypothetical protein